MLFRFSGVHIKLRTIPYTQSQKKHTVDSCVYFGEECSQMNFVGCKLTPMVQEKSDIYNHRSV